MILPTLKQLQYLVALHEHEHFGRAADSTFVTQSTLSAGLRELETTLGVVLVERTRRVMRFTPLGEKVVQKARRVLRETEELTELARASGKPLSGDLRLGVIPTIAPFLLPRVLPILRARWPELKLYLREETTPQACESLQRGALDCILLALPYACGDIESATLFHDPLYVAYPNGEMMSGAASITPQQIPADSLLLLEDGHCLKDHALAACNRPELRAEAQMLGTSLHTLVQMVDNGLGLTLIPKMALDAGILTGTKVEARPLDTNHASREIALVWRANSPRSKEFKMLAAELDEAIHEDLGSDRL